MFGGNNFRSLFFKIKKFLKGHSANPGHFGCGLMCGNGVVWISRNPPPQGAVVGRPPHLPGARPHRSPLERRPDIRLTSQGSRYLPVPSIFPGFFSSWVPWILGSLVPWFLVSLILWFLGSLIPCFLGSWFLGSLVSRYLGPLVPWYLSSLVPWYLSSLAPRLLIPGCLVHKLLGCLVPWFLNPWYLGSLVNIGWPHYHGIVQLYLVIISNTVNTQHNLFIFVACVWKVR